MLLKDSEVKSEHSKTKQVITRQTVTLLKVSKELREGANDDEIKKSLYVRLRMK